MILNESSGRHVDSLSNGEIFIDDDQLLKAVRVAPHKDGTEVFYTDMISGKSYSAVYLPGETVSVNPTADEIQDIFVHRFKMFSKFDLHHDKNNNTFIVLHKSQGQVDAMVKKWNANHQMKVNNLGLDLNDGSIRITFR